MSENKEAVAAADNVGKSSILLNQPIVLDNGTSSIKAGFAGSQKPKVCHWSYFSALYLAFVCSAQMEWFPIFIQVVVGTKVGRSKHMRIMPGGALEHDSEISGPTSIFVGKKLDEHRGAFLLEYPMDKGAVVDGGWDSMERVWEVSPAYLAANSDVGLFLQLALLIFQSTSTPKQI